MRKIMIGLFGLVLLVAAGAAFAGPPIMVLGSEATDGIIYLYADDGDDAGDKWEVRAMAGSTNSLHVYNNSTLLFSIGTNGTMTAVGPIVPSGGITGLQSGVFTGNQVNVTFATAFSTAPSAVVVTPCTTGAAQSAVGEIQGQVCGISTTNFDFCGCAGIVYGYIAY